MRSVFYRKAEEGEVLELSGNKVPPTKDENLRKMTEVGIALEHPQFIVHNDSTIWRKIGSMGEIETGTEEEFISVLTMP